ncbi:hypothetical protein [Aeromonas sp. sif0611]|uniref:hypothetical protein n=1 Tax=Aeromonas sp. sif0611 TaxID=2854787 RepID=UPI001C47919E|nr:hypothetical protein [Aeromonas sp. sif0611]
MLKTNRCALIFIMLMVAGCSHLNDEQKSIKQQSINDMARNTITQLLERDERLTKAFDESLAYMVVDMKVTKIPAVGVGGGEGVLFMKAENKPTFYRVQRFDLGAGWGARSYKALVLVSSQNIMEKLKEGLWVFDIGGEASAGTAAMAGTSSDIIPEYSVHILSDGGVSASITARAIRISKSDLN